MFVGACSFKLSHLGPSYEVHMPETPTKIGLAFPVLEWGVRPALPEAIVGPSTRLNSASANLSAGESMRHYSTLSPLRMHQTGFIVPKALARCHLSDRKVRPIGAFSVHRPSCNRTQLSSPISIWKSVFLNESLGFLNVYTLHQWLDDACVSTDEACARLILARLGLFLLFSLYIK
jgi:hypothetical protein